MGLSRELSPQFARVFGIAACAIGFCILYFFFASLGKLVPAHSDSSYLVLYADAILKGNWLLKGWDLTTVGFYTELPFYVVAVKLTGVQPDLIRLVPAFIYALNVTLVLLLIRKYRIVDGYWTYLPAIAFLILPSNGIWPMALNGAIHMVTLSLGLVMLLCLNDRLIFDRARRSILLFLICAIGVWGDLSFALFFVLPLLFAGLALHRGSGEDTRRFLLSVAAPAMIGVVAGHAIVSLAKSLGWGAPVGVGAFQFEARDMILPKAQFLVDSWINFFGPDMWGLPLGIISLAKLALGFGVVWWALCVIRAFKDSDSGFDLFAAIMPLAIGAAAVLSHRDGDNDATRLVVPAFFVSTVLMSRLAQRNKAIARWTLASPLMLVAALIVSAKFISDNRMLMAGDGYMSQFRAAVNFLESRSLKQGFGDFWSTQVMRVASGNDLGIVPMAFVDDQGTAVPWHWAADRRWFEQPAGNFVLVSGLYGETFQQRSFSLLGSKNLVGNYKYTTNWRDRSIERARKHWGEPSEVHYFGELAILIYNRPIELGD